jgi:inner membrane protein
MSGARQRAGGEWMASIFSHPAVPLAIGLGLGSGLVTPRLLLAGVAACLLPDLDVIAFRLGVPYESAFAHRGFTHSLFFALLCGAVSAAYERKTRKLQSRPWITFAFISVAVASHGLLDAFTTGGSGIAFFWPFGDERYFMPLRIILVSPIGMGFFSERGVMVLLSELKWVWLPCSVLAAQMYLVRHACERWGKK